MSNYTHQQLTRISELDAEIDAAADKGDDAFFTAVAAKDEYIDSQGIDRDRLEVTGRETQGNVSNYIERPHQVQYVIHSLSESDVDLDGAVGAFWSNEDGWGSLQSATLFSTKERMSLNLPMSAKLDAEWMLAEEARDLDANRNPQGNVKRSSFKGTKAPEVDGVYELSDGRFSRFLNGQWRLPNSDVSIASNEARLDAFPSPQYRIKDHHRWSVVEGNVAQQDRPLNTDPTVIEAKVMKDYAHYLGKDVLVNRICGYVGDDSTDIELSSPAKVRVETTSEQSLKRWIDGWCDPLYEVSLVEDHPQLNGVRSLWIHGPSLHLNGKQTQASDIVSMAEQPKPHQDDSPSP